MAFKSFRKAYRLLFPAGASLGMNELFGKRSLGWTTLPQKPCFIKGKIFDDHHICLPWFTYSATAQLLRWHLRDQVIVEYGSGSSTKFFSEQNAKLVVSQEDNSDWFGFVGDSMGAIDNLVYNLAEEKDDYVLSAEKLSEIKPSIILIDGSHRADCAEVVCSYVKGLEALSSPALVILDNSDWFGKTYSILSSLEEYSPLDFYGHGPFNHYSWCTTFFVNPNSCFADKLFSYSKNPATPMINGLQGNFSMDV